jgi:hypothetical protein
MSLIYWTGLFGLFVLAQAVAQAAPKTSVSTT